MSDFQRDFEVIVSNVDFINNGTIRFQMSHMERMVGSLDNLNIGERAYNALRRNKIHNIETLTERIGGLNGVRGTGKKIIKEIKNEYMNYYYSLLSEEERMQFWCDTYEATLALAGVETTTVESEAV